MTIRQTRYQAIAAGFAHGKNLQRCMTMFASVQILQSRTCNLSLSMNNNSKHRRPQSLRGRMQHLAESDGKGRNTRWAEVLMDAFRSGEATDTS
jgi:hypothetical protein